MRIRTGRALFVLAWPALYIYLLGSHRTRVVIKYRDEVLAVKDWLGRGKWVLPGGGLHNGEAEEVGAAREIYEETGLALNPSDLQLLLRTKHHGNGFKFEVVGFVAEMDAKPEPPELSHELTEARWIKITDLNPKNSEPDTLLLLSAVEQ